ncbi:MAG: hypothetical protein ACYC96_14835 [Fimbriimonadaceae bacterium]
MLKLCIPVNILVNRFRNPTVHSWSYVAGFRLVTDTVRIVWEGSITPDLFLRDQRQFGDHWQMWRPDMFGPPEYQFPRRATDNSAEYGYHVDRLGIARPGVDNIGEWVAAEYLDKNLGGPYVAPIRSKFTHEHVLRAFLGIHSCEDQKRFHQIGLICRHFGPLGTGVRGYIKLDDPSAERLPVLLEPVALWRLESRAALMMTKLLEISRAADRRTAEALRQGFDGLKGFEHSLTDNEKKLVDLGAKALHRIELAVRHVSGQDESGDQRVIARRAYTLVVNDVLQHHAKVALTEPARVVRVRIEGAYGLLYYALACQLALVSPTRVCARPGCAQLLPIGSRRNRMYCSDSCSTGMYRDRKGAR